MPRETDVFCFQMCLEKTNTSLESGTSSKIWISCFERRCVLAAVKATVRNVDDFVDVLPTALHRPSSRPTTGRPASGAPFSCIERSDVWHVVSWSKTFWDWWIFSFWMFFFVSGFLTQEPGAEMSSEISTSKCHACFRGLTEQAWLQQVQREDGPARQQRSKPSPAFWELVELWTESLSCIGALASDTLSRIALQAWLSPDLTLLIWWMMNATLLFIFLFHLHPFAFHGHSDRNSWEHWTRQSSWVFDALSSGNSRVKRTVVVAAFLVPVFSTSVKSKSF